MSRRRAGDRLLYLFRRQNILSANTGRLVLIVITLTGTVLLMGSGADHEARRRHGISLLIFASIIDRAPLAVRVDRRRPDDQAVLPLLALCVIVAVVFMQEGQRRIPIQYAKRQVGRRMTAGGSTYLPLRVNMAASSRSSSPPL